MKKSIFLLLSCICISISGYAQLNMTLKGQLPYASSLASLWGWHDGNGNEYALVGANPGLSIVDVTNPFAPVQVQFVATQASNWHEIKTWQHYAYCVNESGGGMLIVDLQYLPDSVVYVHDYFQGYVPDSSGHFFHTGHTVTIDENGFLYINGSGNGIYVFDLNTNPMNPDLVGLNYHYGNTYVHDCYVRNNKMYTADIYAGRFRVMDVTVKNAPVLLAMQNTPWNFTHNTWLSDNGNVLFATDEVAGSYVTAYDISNLSNITELDRFTSNPGTSSVPHNVHVLNDWLVIAHYRDGVVIADAHRPSNLIKTGNYDTYSQGAGSGFNGCWGVYPYLPSGNILASDISNGLFVLGVTYNRACYLEGTVTDSATGNPLSGVTVSIAGAPGAQNAVTPLNGTYATGTAAPGTYTVTLSKSGYVTKSFSVSLAAGNVTVLNTVMNLPPVCAAPGTLTATAITNNSATLNWSNVGATSYLVSWKRIGGGGTSTATTTGTSLNITGLQSCKQYQFNVRATCPGGTNYTSAWKNFTTTGSRCRVTGDGTLVMLDDAAPVYPNPFNDQLTVLFTPGFTGNASASLFDAAGRLVSVLYEGTLSGEFEEFTVQLGGIEKGMYFIMVREGDDIKRFSVVKQ